MLECKRAERVSHHPPGPNHASRREDTMAAPSIYPPVVAGSRYGKLLVEAQAESRRTPRGEPKKMWACVCDCGEPYTARDGDLKRGRTNHCGCETPARLSKTSRKHGASVVGNPRQREFRIWRAMLNRCRNRNSKAFSDYGGRGIRVCARWQESFEAFYEDMGPSPSRGHSIDRYPNKDGDYRPDNCRWATRREQNQNTRRNLMVTLDGTEMCLSEASRVSGVGLSTVSYRRKRGVPLERCFDPPGSFPSLSRV